MEPKQAIRTLFHLFAFCLLLSGYFTPVYAIDSTTPQNPTTTTGDQPDVSTILASAHESATQIGDPTQRYNSLITLAEACLRVQDKNAAMKVLSEAKALSPSIKIYPYMFSKFIELSLKAGNIEDALASAQTAPGLSRIYTMSAIGENMAQNGNISGAKNVLKSIASISEADIAPPPANLAKAVATPNFGQSLADAITAGQCKIGIAFASNNDLPDAISIAKSTHNNICRIDLFGAIAAAEQKAGQSDASRQTLADISAVISNEAPHDNNIEWVRRAALAFGINDDLVDAKTVIDKLAAVPGSYTEQQIRELASSQVIESIAKSGDTLHASSMLGLLPENKRGSALLAIAQMQITQGHMQEAHATLETAYKSELSDTQTDLATMKDAADRATEFKRSEIIQGHVESLVAIGKTMAKQGDVNYAKTILSSAYTCVLYTHAPVNPSGMFMTVVGSQIEIGAYTDALTTTNKIEAINRMQFIIRLINEEVKHNDKRALSETVPVALKTAQESPPLVENGQARLAETLASAGYPNEAQEILGVSEKNIQNSAGWQKMDQLASLKNTQAAMGDETGKAKTAAQMQEETQRFDAEIAKATADAQAKGLKQIDIAGAMQLMQKIPTANPEDAKQYINQALKMVGNDGRLLETLMYINARYHPPVQPNTIPQNSMTISQLISKNDFPAAVKQIDSLTGKDKDAALLQLGQAEAEAGQYKLAYATMNNIGDPVLHTSGLMQLIPQK